MKQMIILLAMILLGIALAGFILSFKDSAKTMTDSAKTQMENVLTVNSGSKGE